VDGNNVSVFAGAWAADPDQGTLQVIWKVYYLGRSIKGQYVTPGRHGSVHITVGENNRLTLVSTDGSTFYFDVPGLQFVPSLTELVPTITPPPNNTPQFPSTAPAPTAYPIASDTEASP